MKKLAGPACRFAADRESSAIPAQAVQTRHTCGPAERAHRSAPRRLSGPGPRPPAAGRLLRDRPAHLPDTQNAGAAPAALRVTRTDSQDAAAPGARDGKAVRHRSREPSGSRRGAHRQRPPRPRRSRLRALALAEEVGAPVGADGMFCAAAGCRPQAGSGPPLLPPRGRARSRRPAKAAPRASCQSRRLVFLGCFPPPSSSRSLLRALRSLLCCWRLTTAEGGSGALSTLCPEGKRYHFHSAAPGLIHRAV